VVLLGRGASGKSTLARQLGAATGIPVVELDTLFWRPDLTPTAPAEWAAVQQEQLVRRPAWIADGDLGPYDVLDVRLAAADTVVLLDFSLARCAWRAVRRSRERSDFWRWVVGYRRRWRPLVLGRVGAVAPAADLHVLRGPRAVRRFLAGAAEQVR
jgi:adenylate kinase family enzyme